MFLWCNLAQLWMPPRMPLSLAHEDISEEKGVGFANFGRHLIAPDGKYIFFHSPGTMLCESPNRALVLSSGKFLSTKTLFCLHL